MRKYLLIICLFASFSLSAQIRREILDIEKQFDRGKFDEVTDLLSKQKPSNDEERALLGHVSAAMMHKKSEALRSFIGNADRYPKTLHGQKSMLEAAKLYVLERDVDAALAQLRKISSTQLPDRLYWMAVCAFWQDNFTNAISHAEEYLKLVPSGVHAESALYIVVDSYLEQKKYYSALTTLNKISKIKDRDEQYLQYMIGYANELSGKNTDALQAYKAGYDLNKYSQIAFNIEERLFVMRSRNPSIDIGFLYPYTPLDIAVTPSTPDSANAIVQSNPITPPTPSISPVNADLPTKVKEKPKNGLYLQAGRFSVEINASKLVVSMREMQIPAVYYEDRSKTSTTWVVLAGPFIHRDDADTARKTLSAKEINSFVIQF